MNRWLARFVVALVLGGACALLLREQTGYVMASWGPYVLEASALGFIFALGVALLTLYGIAWALRYFIQLPQTMRHALAARRARAAQASFEGGVQRLIEGRWPQAEAELLRRAADHEAGGLNYLLAATAAQRAGAPDRRDRYLELAASRGEDAADTATLVRASLAIDRGDRALAVGLLQPLARRSTNPYVTRLLAEALGEEARWTELGSLLATADSIRALPPERHRELSVRVALGQLNAASVDASLEKLKSVWQNAAPEIRDDRRVRAEYVLRIARLGAEREAASIITAALAREFDRKLVEAYSALGGIDSTTQLATVEQWLQQHGEQHELLLAAGRVCTRHELWGKARAYLEGALKLSPEDPYVLLALARLAAATKNPAEAAEYYRRGLEAVTA